MEQLEKGIKIAMEGGLSKNTKSVTMQALNNDPAMQRPYLIGSSQNKFMESGPVDVSVPTPISEHVEIFNKDIDCHMEFVGARSNMESVSEMAEVPTPSSH